MQSIDVGRRVTEEHLEGFPSPVAHSLRHSGVVGTPIPHRVSVTQTGRLRRAADKPGMKFEAVETYGVADPSFQWTASLKVGGMSLGRAVDTLAEGRGRMHVRLLGLIDVVDADPKWIRGRCCAG